MCSNYHLVPAGEGDDKRVKQTIITHLRKDPIVIKAALRLYRLRLGFEVQKYMKRLVLLQPELVNNTDAMQEDYFDKVFEGRTFDEKKFTMKF